MKSLYVRIYLTVVAAVALFALVSGWLLQSGLESQRMRNEGMLRDRAAAWGELLQRSLPEADAPLAEQTAALREWSQRLRLPLALDDDKGRRLAASDSFLRRDLDGPGQEQRLQAIRFDDGRTLWVPRLPAGRLAGPGRQGDMRPLSSMPGLMPGRWTEGTGLLALLLVLFLAVAGGAWPVVRRLTRRLEALKQGVDNFGAGQLSQRVAEDGKDEVAALGTSFNRAATRIQALLASHQSLLANASHELRSPLARLKLAVSLMEETAPEGRAALREEIHTNITELDALVEEVLLASRLNGEPDGSPHRALDLSALVREEGAKVGVRVDAAQVSVDGDERLLRRAVRNLLENAQRYGGQQIEIELRALAGEVELQVRDRGPGVPESYRERIFEAFFRLPGHAEREGGVGLGLALVRQIALRHQGQVRCEARAGGGSVFVLSLPRQPA